MISIAIDGPSASGKSTIAKEVSKKLGYIYVDTGALYRTIALAVVNAKIDPTDENNVAQLLPQLKIGVKFTEAGQQVTLNDKDVSEEIRLPKISAATSKVSALRIVR